MFKVKRRLSKRSSHASAGGASSGTSEKGGGGSSRDSQSQRSNAGASTRSDGLSCNNSANGNGGNCGASDANSSAQSSNTTPTTTTASRRLKSCLKKKPTTTTENGGGGGGGVSLTSSADNNSSHGEQSSGRLSKTNTSVSNQTATENASHNNNHNNIVTATEDAVSRNSLTSMSHGSSHNSHPSQQSGGTTGMASSAGTNSLNSNNNNNKLAAAGAAAPNASTNSNSSSGGNHNNKTNAKGRKRRVGFRHVQVREYERVISDNPSCSSGAPVGIGWAHGKERTMRVDDYESARPERRSQLDLVLTRQEREMLLVEWGATFQQIVDAIRANIKAKNQRRRTVNSIGTYDRWEEVIESAGRKIKRTLLLQRPTRKQVADMEKLIANTYSNGSVGNGILTSATKLKATLLYKASEQNLERGVVFSHTHNNLHHHNINNSNNMNNNSMQRQRLRLATPSGPDDSDDDSEFVTVDNHKKSHNSTSRETAAGTNMMTGATTGATTATNNNNNSKPLTAPRRTNNPGTPGAEIVEPDQADDQELEALGVSEDAEVSGMSAPVREVDVRTGVEPTTIVSITRPGRVAHGAEYYEEEYGEDDDADFDDVDPYYVYAVSNHNHSPAYIVTTMETEDITSVITPCDDFDYNDEGDYTTGTDGFEQLARDDSHWEVGGVDAPSIRRRIVPVTICEDFAYDEPTTMQTMMGTVPVAMNGMDPTSMEGGHLQQVYFNPQTQRYELVQYIDPQHLPFAPPTTTTTYDAPPVVVDRQLAFERSYEGPIQQQQQQQQKQQSKQRMENPYEQQQLPSSRGAMEMPYRRRPSNTTPLETLYELPHETAPVPPVDFPYEDRPFDDAPLLEVPYNSNNNNKKKNRRPQPQRYGPAYEQEMTGYQPPPPSYIESHVPYGAPVSSSSSPPPPPAALFEDGDNYCWRSGGFGGTSMQPPPFSNTIISRWE